MRVVIKGGVWKNTEDEILKVAVMKYGKNQWARISSLLNRKTPKQCKARWYEWLDPSIKKTEWSKEEDEKLLHLAKLMPTQWRTISPIIGRTPAQCLERYQKLLDEAERELMGGSSSAADAADVGPSGDEVRRLRPGEIDPDPEVKPARPDPVDMDEDEKEMLSEARARLANTQGKKAKRKARERLLEESRRLAALQKRRELKAQGITMKPKKSKGDDMDYIKDIPFQRVPLPGFYDAANELGNISQSPLDKDKALLLSQMDGKRSAEREEAERRKDIKRRKLRDQQGAHTDPSLLAFVGSGSNAAAVFESDTYSSTRLPLNLPAPQITEQDIEQLSKSSGSASLVDTNSDLVSDYSVTPRAPLRTPRMVVAENVRAYARAAVQAKELQTPLLGEDQSSVSLVPQSHSIVPPSQTPMTASRLGGSTPFRGADSMSTAGDNTPFRDRMGINTPRTTTARSVTTPNQHKSLLKQALMSLPKPKNNFEIVLPKVRSSTSSAASARVVDRTDIDQAMEGQYRTQVIERDLPRPIVVPTLEELQEGSLYTPGSTLYCAETLIFEEMRLLMLHDAYEFPIHGAVPIDSKPEDLDDISNEQSNEAKAMMEANVPEHLIPSVQWFLANPDCSEQVYDPSSGTVVDPSCGTIDWHPIYQSYVDAIAACTKEADKLELKCKVAFAGYANRVNSLAERLTLQTKAVHSQVLTLDALQVLAVGEEQAAPLRLADAQVRLDEAVSEQKRVQVQYAEVMQSV